MANSVFCNNCGEPIEGEPPGEPIEGEPPIADDPAARPPCPKCGSTSRNVTLSMATGIYTSLGSVLTLTRSEETLLTKAQKLITKGDFSIAVVVAHMACEISAERAISQAFAAKGIGYLEESVVAFLSGYNLANERIRNLYNALSGDKIQKQSFWQAFKESAERRNKAVHRGGIITKADAEKSDKAASDLVAYLK